MTGSPVFLPVSIEIPGGSLPSPAEPPIVTLAWENPTGTLPTAGTLARLTPDTVQLLALKSRPGSQTVDLRVRNPAATTLRPILVLAGKRYPLGAIPAGTVATFRLNSGRAAQRVPLGG